MVLPQTFKLNTGNEIPAIGFGTWLAKPHEVEVAVDFALRNGYKHIDCASIYRNEREVGAGIKRSGVNRTDIYVTTKLWNSKHEPKDVEAALDDSLKDLGIDYCDLAFSPGDKFYPLDKDGVFKLSNTSYTETWKAMEKLLQTGKAKAIGVSNFNKRRLEELLDVAEVVPAVNQIEAHPYLQQLELTEFCKSKGILIQAYSPLGNNLTGEPRTLEDPIVQQIANDLGLDAAQVLVSWALQRDTLVLPKSVTEKRIISNIKTKELPKDAIEKLNAMEKHKRYNDPSLWWGFDNFDEIGDETVKNAAIEAGPNNLETYTI